SQLVLTSSRSRQLAVTARQTGARVREVVRNLLGAARRGSEPGTGLLPREIATGPRFGLPARSYVLSEAGPDDLAGAGWTARAPWVDRPSWAQSPSIVWPDDHAWVLATEIDFDSTLVAGTRALVEELVHTPGVEALPLSPDADLSWQGDAVNRPG